MFAHIIGPLQTWKSALRASKTLRRSALTCLVLQSFSTFEDFTIEAITFLRASGVPLSGCLLPLGRVLMTVPWLTNVVIVECYLLSSSSRELVRRGTQHVSVCVGAVHERSDFLCHNSDDFIISPARQRQSLHRPETIC